VIFVLIGTLLTGCAAQERWTYEPNRAQAAPISTHLVLAVSPFADAREQDNPSHFFLCLLPAVPYCTATYHRPDDAFDFHTAGSYDFHPSHDLARAAAQEIRQSRLFRDVQVSDFSLPPDAQLILRGTILNTDWNGTRFTYGLAGDGQALWLLGLPVGTASNTLRVKLELVEEATNRVLWTYTIEGSSKTTEGLYYGRDFDYPRIFRDGMKDAVISLAQFVAGKPSEFWEHMRAAR
jgi:hypothetical protein